MDPDDLQIKSEVIESNCEIPEKDGLAVSSCPYVAKIGDDNSALGLAWQHDGNFSDENSNNNQQKLSLDCGNIDSIDTKELRIKSEPLEEEELSESAVLSQNWSSSEIKEEIKEEHNDVESNESNANQEKSEGNPENLISNSRGYTVCRPYPVDTCSDKSEAAEATRLEAKRSRARHYQRKKRAREKENPALQQKIRKMRNENLLLKRANETAEQQKTRREKRNAREMSRRAKETAEQRHLRREKRNFLDVHRRASENAK